MYFSKKLKGNKRAIVGKKESSQSGCFLFDESDTTKHSVLLMKFLFDNVSGFCLGGSDDMFLIGKKRRYEDFYITSLHFVNLDPESKTKRENLLIINNLSMACGSLFSHKDCIGIGRSSIITSGFCNEIVTFILHDKVHDSSSPKYNSYVTIECETSKLLSDGTVVCLTEEGRIEVYRDTDDGQVQCIYQSEKDNEYDFDKIKDLGEGMFATFSTNKKPALGNEQTKPKTDLWRVWEIK